MANHKCKFLFLTLLVYLFLSGGDSQQQQNDYSQVETLLRIKSSFKDPNSVLETWMEKSSSPCHWAGITCDESGYVIQIDLHSQSLEGDIPDSLLASLDRLQGLNLNDNPLNPSPFPPAILTLKSLHRLQLSNCSLYGAIPSELGDLTELTILELSYNSFNGTIPETIGNLTKLCSLQLYHNSLSGPLPRGFSRLTSLQYFDASTNYLNGSIVHLTSLRHLVSLHLYQNNFSGHIPEEFGKFPFLTDLSLYRNQLTGPLPESLGRFSDMKAVDVSENRFNGTLPPYICKRGKLGFLLALENSLTGEIPTSYGDCKTLVRFRLSRNNLEGVVPSAIWGLPHVTILDLGFNDFVGEVTTDIGKAKNLSVLFIQNNRLSGSLPSEIGNAGLLNKIDASNNMISGSLPSEIGNLSLLSSLLLQDNMISGHLPWRLGLCSNLAEMNLAKNSITGTIPESIGSMFSLNSLNLSNNFLKGRIPLSFSGLKLSSVDLSNNELAGPVSSGLVGFVDRHGFSGNPRLCSYGFKSAFLKACLDSTTTSSRKFIMRVVISCVALMLVVGLLVRYFVQRKIKKQKHEEELPWDMKFFHTKSFNPCEILECLKEENLIGKGGSGNVYRGNMNMGDTVAVKHIWNSSETNKELKLKEFNTELQTLSQIRHKNIVKLYCSLSNGVQHLLVYEYMPNGSLWDALHRQKVGYTLDWETRYKIALGVGCGLDYLHHGCVPPIVHRDISSTNILLGEDYEPFLSDFGVAKLLQLSGKSGQTAIIAGTHGYIAPEYAYTYKVSPKSDVYSFGIVLMELVTGKQPTGSEFEENEGILKWVTKRISVRENAFEVIDGRVSKCHEENEGILKWVTKRITQRENAFEVLDGRVSKCHEEQMMKVLKIALGCTSHLPALRPSMREVVQMLQDADPGCHTRDSLIKMPNKL